MRSPGSAWPGPRPWPTRPGTGRADRTWSPELLGPDPHVVHGGRRRYLRLRSDLVDADTEHLGDRDHERLVEGRVPVAAVVRPGAGLDAGLVVVLDLDRGGGPLDGGG